MTLSMLALTHVSFAWSPSFTGPALPQTEFCGAADRLLSAYTERPERLSIEPYDVDVLAREKRRDRDWHGSLAAELRTIDAYLDDVRRAA